jgi:methylated-DNA-[protein]-cysteine S-methyltransferase
MWFDQFKTPIGQLRIAADDEGLRYVMFEKSKYAATDEATWQRDAKALANVREQLLAYFAGDLKSFDVILSPHGTEFQKQVWKTLTNIPYGKTWSYSDIAKKVNSPKAVRAVGAANGRNPIPIILPCHRVIGSNGSLTGFAGGLAMKQWLLEHEGIGQASFKL